MNIIGDTIWDSHLRHVLPKVCEDRWSSTEGNIASEGRNLGYAYTLMVDGPEITTSTSYSIITAVKFCRFGSTQALTNGGLIFWQLCLLGDYRFYTFCLIHLIFCVRMLHSIA